LKVSEEEVPFILIELN